MKERNCKTAPTSNADGLYARPGAISLTRPVMAATQSIRLVAEELHCFRSEARYWLIVTMIQWCQSRTQSPFTPWDREEKVWESGKWFQWLLLSGFGWSEYSNSAQSMCITYVWPMHVISPINMTVQRLLSVQSRVLNIG